MSGRCLQEQSVAGIKDLKSKLRRALRGSSPQNVLSVFDEKSAQYGAQMKGQARDLVLNDIIGC